MKPSPKPIADWPKDDKPASFEDLADEIVAAIRFAYTLKRKNAGKSIPLAGPDAPEGACVGSGSHCLSAENLAYSLDDQGREALDEIVGVAIRLGIEQGRRIHAAELREKEGLLRSLSLALEHLSPIKPRG